MTKTIPFAAIVLVLATAAPQALAQDAPDRARFETTFTVPVSGDVVSVYKDIERQSHRACKRQLRSVETFSIRLDYMRSCKAELTDRAVRSVDRSDLSQLHADATGKTRNRQFAALGR